MGEVYLAEHKYIARRAAIKFLLPQLTSSAEVVMRFFAEARAAAGIEHPGIVQVIDCDVHRDGRAFIVMELLRGESLRAYLERIGSLASDERGGVAMFREIGTALAAAHRQGIVHRDLKPDNIFLHLPTGRPPASPVMKVLDFGIAKLLGVGEGGSKTRTGQLLGTPLYMSPEQCRGARSVDHRSDVYSLGCIMYEVFCGVPPYQAEGFGDLIVAHVSRPIPEPRELAPRISPALRDLLVACLAKEPNDRVPSMEALVTKLAEVGGPHALRLERPVIEPDPSAATGPLSAVPSPVSPQARAAVAATTPAPPGLSPLAARQAVAMATPSVANTATTLQHGASEIMNTVPPPRRRGKGAAIAATVGVAIAAAIVISRLASGSGHPATSATSATAATAARPAMPAATAAPVAAPAVAPATSSIALEGIPSGAVVRLDGKPASLPLVVPRRADEHRLRIEAAGYDPLELSVSGASDRTMAVDMKKAAPSASVPSATAKASDSTSSQKKGSSHSHHSPSFHAFTDL
jgi:tRNA A-37 threonylcarbamoyl transferase component Bud32